LLKQLIHNGVVVPEPPPYTGISLVIRGVRRQLTPKQEEMAMAWARKKDTPYVQDAVFQANFLRDFSIALGVDPALTLREVDWAPLYAIVDAEKRDKEAMSKEQRKALAAERKAQREALKAKHGFAIVNGQRVEIGAYIAEPSGIFMGRGQHPLRGRWKEGAKHSDITLNLSPDAPRPEGDWGEIVWQPDSMWVARWEDKLAAKLKYVWLSDTAPVKQQREADKFDKATRLDNELGVVRSHIESGLQDSHPRRRMIATACYLIDALCLRVGDEKDPDEADTVGATTLRPEHVKLHEDGTVEFKFLGKDSVEWHKKLNPSPLVLANLAELSRQARPSSGASSGNGERGHPTRDLPQLFPDVTSRDVNAYLSGILPGLTAKVFRTHHATRVVRDSLQSAEIKPQHPEYLKWQAANMANLEAAVLCNHTKKESGNWGATKERYQQRQARAEERMESKREAMKLAKDKLAGLREEAREKEAAAKSPDQRHRLRQRYRDRVAKAQASLDAAREALARAQIAVGKIKAQAMIAGKKRTWNLGTSLKSYIDPRVYYHWGQEVDYDVLNKYYPTILQRKFAWVRLGDGEGTEQDEELAQITVRTCMSNDLPALAEMFRVLQNVHPDAPFGFAAEEIGQRYLPRLGGPWREAIIALGEEQQPVALVVLGPEWTWNGQPALDVWGVTRPDHASYALAEHLAEEVHRRLQAYELQHPRQSFALYPQDPTWLSMSEELASALGLAEEEADTEVVDMETATEPVGTETDDDK
jgi:DNA topoisomerase-1